MFCRECALNNLITQKASIEVAKRDLELWAIKEDTERREVVQKARERVVRDFERGMGLSGGIRIGGKDLLGTEGKAGSGEGKFGMGNVEELAKRAEELAVKSIEAEQVESRKTKLAAFWLPSLAPEGRLTPIKDVKLETVCQAGKEPHPMS